jgi:hypothetical protein
MRGRFPAVTCKLQVGPLGVRLRMFCGATIVTGATNLCKLTYVSAACEGISSINFETN